ncbi:hypothetical protein pdam_00021069 [Pocillopora damicornis]|uniref:SLC26A/SulP transporter domain-containing protein n=1 Tax=Pocillopora damicornis TaxID=46731 RepID=A0A3M6TR38_POCDA|nr:hypothetical protein pdam_00021069 [Pocillopora damicornis]
MKTYIIKFKNITCSVLGSVIAGVVCILVLIALKYISEKLKHEMKFPIPAQLIVVVLRTMVSYFVGLNEKFQVSVLHNIPKGWDTLKYSQVTSTICSILHADRKHGDRCHCDSIFIFATNTSLAKTFAKRNNYVIDSN